jgi:hypothetical protein
MTDTDKELFELERLEALRTFEVDFYLGQTYTTERFHAHYHATDDAGHLQLVVIQPNGQQLIQHLFNVQSWMRLTEIGGVKRAMGDNETQVH